jgi:hypothetical protein
MHNCEWAIGGRLVRESFKRGGRGDGTCTKSLELGVNNVDKM